MTKVVAALGADACAAPVLAAANALADMLDATVVALHVGEDGVPSPEALANAARVEYRQTRGTPLEGIVSAANEADVAALVLGSRGASAGPRPAGATALEVITRTAKPVVLVPPDADPPERFARLLLPIEGTGVAPPALSDIIDAADRRKLEIIVLHLHSPATVPAFSNHEPYGTRVWDQEFLARHLPFPADRVRVLRRVGTPADDVPALAEVTGAELIVLIWSQSLAKGRARVVTRTLASTRIPVLLLPSEPSIHRGTDSVHRRTTTKSRAPMRSSRTNG
jgi:nucleotide-binding universal stress UspA family protein